MILRVMPENFAATALVDRDEPEASLAL